MAKDGARVNQGSVILDCDCKNEYQDKTYGKGKRVKNGAQGGYRCTSCGKKS